MLYVFSVFIFLYIGLIIFMVSNSSSKKRALISDIIGTISSSFILVSIAGLIYNDYLKRVENKKKRVTELNTMNSTLLNNILSLFYNNEADLGVLHNEIFGKSKNKNRKVTLSYQEYIGLQIIFTTFLNIYRQYYISGGEKGMISSDLYEALDVLIRMTLSSPKARLFWKENSGQYESLGFIEWMNTKYLA